MVTLLKGIVSTIILLTATLVVNSSDSYATHISSVKYPSYSEIEMIPSGCSSDGKRCANAYYDGYSYNYAKATNAYETKISITRMNQNHVYNAIGSSPQVNVSSTTYLAFDVTVYAKGYHYRNVAGVDTKLRYGGDIWKYNGTNWERYYWFSNIAYGNGERVITETVRLLKWDSGKFRLGAFYETQAKLGSISGITYIDYYNNPYFIYTVSLAICHPSSNTSPCPG